MINQILKIIDDQGNIDELLISMDNAKTDAEILNIARTITVKRKEYGFLRRKIEEEFKSGLNGGVKQNG